MIATRYHHELGLHADLFEFGVEVLGMFDRNDVILIAMDLKNGRIVLGSKGKGETSVFLAGSI